MKIRKEVQAIIHNENKFLLVSKDDNWRLLKGGIQSDETKKQALQRELLEEIGCTLTHSEFVGEYSYISPGVKHDVTVYKVTISGNIAVDQKEINDFIWTTKRKSIDLLEFIEEKELIKKYG